MKEKTRNCLLCGEQFTDKKRSDTKYCSTTCRSKHWQLKKAKDGLSGLNLKKNDPAPDQKTGLFSDVEELGDFFNTVEEVGFASENISPKQNNEESYTENNADNYVDPDSAQQDPTIPEEYITVKETVNNEIYDLCAERLNACRKLIQARETDLADLNRIIEERVKTQAIPDPDFQRVYESMVQRAAEKKRAEDLKDMCLEQLEAHKEEEKMLSAELLHHPPKKEIEKQVKNPAYIFYKIFTEGRNKSLSNTNGNSTDHSVKSFVENQELSSAQEIKESDNNNNEMRNEESLPEPNEKLSTGRIMSAADVGKIKKKLLNFSGKWLEFLRRPQTNFLCIVHGESGHGKSHFCLLFAKYLAENFGNVLYISGEEAFAPTFIEKVEAIGANKVKRLYFIDLKEGENITKEIPNKFHFIVIDSLTAMNIDIDLLKQIREHYSQSGIIAITQTTKEGKIYGSNRIIFESDIAIKVERGTAITTKNRFHQIHKEFEVFTMYKKTPPKTKQKLDEDFDNTV